MNIAIIGYGAMGHMVEKVALARGIKVSAIIDPVAVGATHKEISAASLKNADVCIEFSSPDVAIENIRKVANLKKAHVMATTGWLDRLDEARKIIGSAGTGFIYASNFSIGVNVFYRIVDAASKIINNLPEYDVFGYELHHNRKKDSPSGTAKSIGEILLRNIERKDKIVEDKLDRKIAKDEIHMGSIRGGDIPGTHVIGFDSPADTIELKHTVRTREGLALGSVMAAEWLKGRVGFFTIENFMDEIIK